MSTPKCNRTFVNVIKELKLHGKNLTKLPYLYNAVIFLVPLENILGQDLTKPFLNTLKKGRRKNRE